MKRLTTMIISAATVLALAATAQTPPSGTVQERRKMQQERIAQGVASGQLTAGETSKLEGKEARINKEVRNEKAANGGTLTPAERRQVNRQQNSVSNQIYNDKHNTTTQKYGANEVDARRKMQQERIAQGIASGKMSAGEAAKIQKQESTINRQVHSERAANGGNLTNNQKAQINREQNRESQKIYTDKHN